MRPRIGVLPLHNCEKETLWINPLYFGGVEMAGGLPVLLPLSADEALWEEYCRSFDGFVFTGGQDVAPSAYGEEKLPECGYQSERRDKQELWMLRRLRDMDKPVLGICRGIQTMNAAFGGTLYQDLPTQHPSGVIHGQQKPYDLPHHQVSLLPGTRLHQIVGHDRLSVNSMHHQAVKALAPGFRAAAISEDGLIEAMELRSAKFFLGVQWHPEHLWQQSQAARAIWQGLVDASK